MKATISPTALLKELKKMSVVIRKNPVIPMMSSVLFKFEKNKVILSATDLETTYISSIDCICSKPFSIPIVYQDIVDAIGSLVNPLVIEISDKTVNLSCDKWKSKLPVAGEAEHFPLPPTDDFFIDFDADSDFFYHLSIANTCKHKDDPRMDMPAIEITKECINVLATDSNVLYKKELPVRVGKEKILMVSGVFANCCKLFQDSKINIGETYIKATYNDETIISRLSEQKFPSYRMVIRPNIVYNLTVDREQLKSHLSSVSFAADFKYKQVNMFFEKDLITLKSQNIDTSKEGTTEIQIEHQVETPEVGFNSDKMMHFLNILTSEKVDFSFISESGSIYIKPSNDESIFCLLQPVLIQNN